MKKAVLFLVFIGILLFLPSPAHAAAAIVQTCSNQTSSGVTSITCTFGAALTSGNFVIGDVGCDSNTLNAVSGMGYSDGGSSNTYTNRYSLTGIGPGAGGTYTFTAPVTQANTALVATPTFSLGSTCVDGMTIIAREYSGLTASPIDQTATIATFSSGTTFTSNTTGTTSQADEVLVSTAYLNNGGSTTLIVGSTYGNFLAKKSLYYYIGIEDKTVAATGTYNATMTSANAATGIGYIGLITLKVAGAAAAVVPRRGGVN